MGVPRHAGLPTSRHLHVLAVPDTPATGGAVGKGDTGVQLLDPSPTEFTRRRFLQGAAATAGALALGGLGRVRAGLAQTSVLPPPALSGIEHVVLLMMENRSFDHLLGWLPGADGMQAGLTYLDRAGVPHSTHRLAPGYPGCGHPAPDHSHEGGGLEYHHGAAHGRLRAGADADYAPRYSSPQGPTS